MFLNSVISILIIFSFCSCKKPASADQMFVNAIKTDIVKNNINIGHSYNIFLLTGYGCPACSRTYLQFIIDFIVNRKNTVIYSTASSMTLDISPLLSDTIYNIIDGDQLLIDNSRFNQSSYFIRVINNQIDTIISIQANDLVGTIKYLKSTQ